MRATVTVIVVAVICAYFIYEPFPEDLEETWKVRYFTTITRAVATLGNICAFIGYDQFPQVRSRIIADRLMKTRTLEDDDLEIFDTTFDSVEVRVYKHWKSKGLLPGAVFIHGGGWVVFSADTYDGVTRLLAKETKTVVVSVNYRRAPEHQFPIPMEDCLVATKYFLKHAEQFGANPTKIGVVGDSAGGNLAAAVTQILVRKKDKSLEQLKFQALIYPTLQAFNWKLPSFTDHSDFTTPLLKARDVVVYWLLYNNVSLVSRVDDVFANRHISKNLKKSKYSAYVSADLLPLKYRAKNQKYTVTEDDVLSRNLEKILINPDSSPLMSDNLSGLPPSLVITAEYDPLRDDGLLYVRRLKDSGVKVRNHHEQHSFHGFFTNLEHNLFLGMTNFKALGRSLREISSFIKQNI